MKKYSKTFMKLACNHGAPVSDAEDIVMDAFWSFYQSQYYGKLDEKGTRLMMAKVVKNKCIDRYRKYKTEEELTVCEDVNEVYGISATKTCEPEHLAIAEESCRKIRAAIENLKPVWRDAAIMYFLEERTHAEISKALGISEVVCRARVSRARKFLEQELKEELEEFRRR